MRVVVFTPVESDGITSFCLSHLYDDAPSASQVSDTLVVSFTRSIVMSIGCSVITGSVPKLYLVRHY